MRFPDFLVIGAMKSGTTSLCEGLMIHPNIYFPSIKEPHFLINDDIFSESGKINYSFLFNNAKENQLIGEGSTGYSKFPRVEGVPERALKICGPNLKIIYIVRDPVKRAESHHFHDFRSDRLPEDFCDAVKKDSMIIKTSLYGLQLSKWLEYYPPENIFVIQFEQFITERSKILNKVFEFLGLDSLKNLPEMTTKNKGESQRVPKTKIGKSLNKIVKDNSFFRKYIHPIIPHRIKEFRKKYFLLGGTKKPNPPNTRDIKKLNKKFEADQIQYREVYQKFFPFLFHKD